MNKRILIAEQEEAIARALQDCLNSFGYTVVGVVDSGDAVFSQTAVLHPDLVLIDVSLGEFGGGVDAAKRIAAEVEVPIIFLATHGEGPVVMENGVWSDTCEFMVEPSSVRELRATIEFALYRHAKERQWREASSKLLEALRAFDAPANGAARDLERLLQVGKHSSDRATEGGRVAAVVADPPPRRQPKGIDTLSPREREVLGLFLRGYGTATIGMRLHVAPQTVRNHLKNACRKLDVRTQIQLRELFIVDQ